MARLRGLHGPRSRLWRKAAPVAVETSVIAEMEAIEAAWKDPGDYTDGMHWPCLFYDLSRFAVLLDSAVTAISDTAWYHEHGLHYVPRSYLEAGVGIGTKAAYAKRAHGLYCEGIDRIAEYVAASRRLGINAYMSDAATCSTYRDFGIVYVNHPFRRREEEEPLERRIQGAMMPGAVLIAVNTTYWPQDWEPLEPRDRLWPMHGAWRKPAV